MKKQCVENVKPKVVFYPAWSVMLSIILLGFYLEIAAASSALGLNY